MSELKQNIIFLKDYQPAPFQIHSVDLTFDLEPTKTTVTAVMNIEQRAGVAGAPDLVLQGEELALVSVQVDNKTLKPADYTVDIEQHTLTLKALPPKCVLTIVNTMNPEVNTSLSGLYCSNRMFCTQCEAEGFRRITYFLDRPDVMAVYTTTIVADKVAYPVLLSNGNLVARGDVESDRRKHWATWSDPFPKPSYLFALVAGPLVAIEDYYVTQSNRLVTLKIYVEPENQDACAHAMQALKRAMRWDEERYGREYDLDIYMIVAVNDFNMGAMENKGLNVFNAKYILARPEFATDTDFSLIDAVIAHEYFHNWSGNRVTCRDWFQLCLKEGLTVFREQHFSEDAFESPTHRIEAVQALRARQFPEDAGPMAHPVRPDHYLEINNFYTMTVYEKGAEVIRMLRTLLGDAVFRQGMDRYFDVNDGKAATVEDFLEAMQTVSGVDLTQFKRWYTQAGTPVVSVEEQYDGHQQTYTLMISQHCPPTPGQEKKQPLHIPIALGLLDRNGEDMALKEVLMDGQAQTLTAIQAMGNQKTYVCSLTKPQQTAVFKSIKEKPVLSFLRGFSAPVKIEQSCSTAEHLFLVKHDSDAVNRWNVMQSLSRTIFLEWVDLSVKKPNALLPEKNPIVDVYRDILEDDALSLDLKTALLTPPSLTEWVSHLTEVHMEAVETVYRYWMTTVAKSLAEHWVKGYDGLQELGTEKYVFEPKAIAQRAFRNLCLWYCGQTGYEDLIVRCVQQYHKSQHMTDALAAMRAVMHVSGKQRVGLLKEYEERWRHHPLAMNKWFAVQAQSWLPDTLQNVKKLSEHTRFSWQNPNNVYSLVSAFATHNLFRFHQAEGGGYAWLAESILKLDPKNPQVAARLMQGFMDWRKYDALRQEKMKIELKRIESQANLSKDVFELVEKYLK